MSSEPTLEELNESINALQSYKERLKQELTTISQKLRMPQHKIDLALSEHIELQKVDKTLNKLINQRNQN